MRHTPVTITVLLFSVLLTNVAFANSTCSTSYCVQNGYFSSIGGGKSGANHELLASDMSPYPQRDTWVETYYPQAIAYLGDGKTYRESLLLLGGIPGDGSPIGNMLADPTLNYETAGLLAGLAEAERRLQIARDTFAIALYRRYPDEETARTNLLDTLKTLAGIYLIIGDEYLVDALEWRFSSDTLGLEDMLDEQITLLEKSHSYYRSSLDAFIHGFSPAVGTNIYIADSFDESVFSLFDLSVERLSQALREKAAKQLVRLVEPADQDDGTAHATALTTIKEANTVAYLASAAIAATKAQNSSSESANLELLNVLGSLRKQGNIYNKKLNPLGYDERFVPMQDYRVLYEKAVGRLNDVAEAESDFEAETREFDANWEKLQGQVDSLISQYVPSLSSLTGCSQPSNLDDPVQIEDFLTCTGEAGGDLFDCRLEQTTTEFEACVSSAQTGGVLAQKYRAIRESQTRIDAARLRHDNIFARMDLENEKADRLIEIKRNQTSAHTTLLDKYLKKLKRARTITDTVTISSVRDRKDGEWGSKTKTRNHSTTTTFAIEDEKLELETDKAKELLALTTEFEIEQINTQTAFVIKDLLLSAAEAEIEIDLAIQQKNSIIADFDNTYQEKENLWYRYQRAQERLSYYTDKVATLRILRSQAAIDLSEDLNYAVHHAYLAAKALEYQRVSDSGIAFTNLFKVQTHDDLQEYLNGLDDLAVSSCQWGSLDSDYHEISLAYHILGLTDQYLDPDGDGVTADGSSVAIARIKAVRHFINTNINDEGNLEFSFAIADMVSFLSNSRRYNLKLWSGSTLPPCDQPVNQVKGIAVNIVTDQSGTPRPKVRLRKNGHSTIRDAFGDIQEFIPYTNFYRHPQDQVALYPYKEAEFTAFINEDNVRNPTSIGTWTGSFKGRGIASSDWVLEVFDDNVLYAPTNFSDIYDIRLHMDTIGECCF